MSTGSSGPAAGGGWITLYRAVSPQELADIMNRGGFFPGPPSFQGKWFAESPEHAAAWGQLFLAWTGGPCHIVEVELPLDVADQMFRLPNLDQIGPARFADLDLLPVLNQTNRGIREVPGTP
jgi:hypothetical protein